MSLVISGATIIDGIENMPIEGKSVLIEKGRISAIARHDEFSPPAGAQIVDARGKYVIPGLMNANVHLLSDVRLENLVRHAGHYEELIAESAQVALKNGLTTVFDTWGPRRFLMAVRDRINEGKIPGSRMFIAGNIVGFDGPYSEDFSPKVAEAAPAALIRQINAIWVENVGRHLMWLPPDRVASEVRNYIRRGIDFVKYASNEHFGSSHGAFLAFSPYVQSAIVEEAHCAGLTAQAHTMTVEGLRLGIEAGCDLIQHANHTGPVPIPEATLELLARRKTAVVVFPFLQRRLDWLLDNESYRGPTEWQSADSNVRNLMHSDVSLLLGNDGHICPQEVLGDPRLGKVIRSLGMPGEDNLFDLGTGHFVWLKAMEEKGCGPMDMLKAATRNIAVAYGKGTDLGTLEPGKVADALILDKNPLQAAENYRSIHMIIKDGMPVDRQALPLNPIQTKVMGPPAEEEAIYIPFLRSGTSFPLCPTCTRDE